MTESLNKSLIKYNHIYQIWYDEKTRKQGYGGFEAYYNHSLSPFFENAVINHLCSSVLPSIDPTQWFGVLSPKFFTKARIAKPIKLDRFLQEATHQCVGFNFKTINKYPLLHGDAYHPGFAKCIQLIVKKALDLDLPKDFQSRVINKWNGHVIRANVFSNYIIAKAGVWSRFYNEFFKPCYEVMNDIEEEEIQSILWRDSGYHRKNQLGSYLKEHIGVSYYPYHTFICERFWTIYLALNTDVTFTHFTPNYISV